MRKYAFGSLFLGVATATLLAAGVAVADSTVKLRIMETTDIHVYLVDYDYYRDRPSASVGLAKVATLIEAARAEASNSILLDNGDLIQGNPLGDYAFQRMGLKQGDVHPVYKAMNLLNYAAGNIGNHEFNYGLEFLGVATGGANFPYVSANIYHDDGDDNAANDKTVYDPYTIIAHPVTAEDGRKLAVNVGIIGFVPPQIMQWDKANLEGKVKTVDIVEAARRYVPEMRANGADVVIAVAHSGLASVDRLGMDENAAYYLSTVEGIDALLFGHAHSVFPGKEYAEVPGADVKKGTLNGVAATMPGFWGSHLGIVDLSLNVDDAGKWTVVDSTGSVRAIYKRDGRKKIPLVEADARIVEAVRAEHEATIAYMREAVGETTAPINSFFALVADDPSIQIVTNAQKWYLGKILQGTEYDGLPILSAGAPFKAGGRGGPDYFTNIPAGEIALKNVADLYIYPNTLRAVLLTGTQVREWLEMSAGQFNQIDPNSAEEQALLNPDFRSYNFDVIDGVEYRIDLTGPARYAKSGEVVAPDSHRIKDLTFDGKPIDLDAKFVVATNNYRAGGGGHFPGLDGSTIIVEAPDENRTVLANYIFEKKKINPAADMNWSFVPIAGNVNVTFPTSPAAAAALGDLPIEAAGQAADGFAKYRLKF